MTQAKEEKEFKPSETKRIVKNVVIISLAFMMHFTAYSVSIYHVDKLQLISKTCISVKIADI